jgi:AraC-like DNA-binding protein
VVARCDGPISDTFRILFHQSGRIDHRINGKESISLPGRCTIHPPRADLKLDIESFSLLLLSLDGDFVRSALNQRFSKLPPFEEWATSFSLESPSIATLNSLCLWLAKELENPQSPLITQDRVAANFERTLLTLFVEGLVERHPETASVRGNLSDVHVSQAEEWIDAHLAEPIGLEEVAAGMGVDAQALVRTFKRLRGQSPLRAILRRRLERARNALQSAEPGATVTEIATGLGFFELGRFAPSGIVSNSVNGRQRRWHDGSSASASPRELCRKCTWRLPPLHSAKRLDVSNEGCATPISLAEPGRKLRHQEKTAHPQALSTKAYTRGSSGPGESRGSKIAGPAGVALPCKRQFL